MSKEEIQRKINSYYALRNKVDEMINTLNSAYSALNDSERNINTAFSVNGVGADNNEVEKKKNDIQLYITTLRTTIRGSINSKINRLNIDLSLAED